MGTKKENPDLIESIDETVGTQICGIVMPIAAMGDYSASHWVDVQNIIKEAVKLTGYEARLVSESKDSTVIPKSIVQNLYDDDIVVCDVSGKNPNVMFELGMRLAFDKPVVLIKDSMTGYSFDTSSIEHLEYPRDLRYSEIQIFKQKLTEKLLATREASLKDGYRSFLSNFATIKVAQLEQTTLNESQVLERILTKLDNVESRLNDGLSKRSVTDKIGFLGYIIYEEEIGRSFSESEIDLLKDKANQLFGDLIDIRIYTKGNKPRLRVMTSKILSSQQRQDVLNSLEPELGSFLLPF